MGVHTCIACMCVVENAYVCGEEGDVCLLARYRQRRMDRPPKKFVEMRRSVGRSGFGETKPGGKTRSYFPTKLIRSYSSLHDLIRERHITHRDNALDKFV